MFFSNSITFDMLGILVALIAVVVVYFKWTYTYWSRKGVPTPKNISIPFGNAANLFLGKQNFGELWWDIYNELKQKGKPYGGAYFLTKKFFVPTDPEIIKCIVQKDFNHFVNHGGFINEEIDPLSGNLFSLEDAKWRNLRAKLTPTFTSGKMKMMFDTLAKCGDGLVEVMDTVSLKGDPIDIKEILGCFSTDIIGSCAFGIECNSLANPDVEFRKYGKMVFEPSRWEQIKTFLQFALPKKLLNLFKMKQTNQQVEDFFMGMVRKTVDYREQNNIYRKDFMHLLLQLKNLGKLTDDEQILDGKIGEVGLNFNELTAQAFVFFVAGFETSSTTMTFTLYEIALNQEIQEKMREEINTVLKNHDNKLTYDAVMEMTYMDKVINETLRKYPPIPFLPRECTEDYTIPETDILVEKGTMVAIPTMGLHYDHEYYPNPIVFDPERFNEENKSSRPSHTWLPFGEGPRVCIGLRFGMMQSKVGLASILKNYEISLNRKTSAPIKFDPEQFILSSKDGIWLNSKKIQK